MNRLIFFILLLASGLLHAQVKTEKDMSELSMPELSKLLEAEIRVQNSAEDRKDKTGTAHALGNVGDIYLNIARQQSGAEKKATLNKSMEYSNKSIAISEEVGDLDQLKASYKNLAAAQKMSGNLKGAVSTYGKIATLKKSIFSKKAGEIEKKQLEYQHQKREDSMRVAAELQQRKLDSASRTLSAAEAEKKSVSLALAKTQSDLTLEKKNVAEKEKKLTLAEQEKALQATNLQLQQSKLDLQNSELQLQQNKLQLQQNRIQLQKDEMHMKDKVLGLQRTYIYIGFAGILILSVFSFFIVRESRKAVAQKRRAERSEKFKQEFIANISHEIRTPMNAINGMTSLLLNKGPRPEQESYLKAISKSSDILLHVINDVLDLSKIEAGKLELEKIDFSLSETIRQVTDTLSYRAEDKGLQLIARIDENLDDVLVGDPYRLNQILINLGGNALKFTEKGGVHIDLDLEKKEGDCVIVRFSVSDTGIGIPADKIPTLFESFTQVSKSDTRRYGGTGLGLSISKYLVELQGGKISVESIVGSGTTFSFVIKYPVGSPAALLQRVYAEQHVDGTVLNGLRVLIADDNEYNRLVVNETLHLMCDIHTDLAVNGKEVVDMVTSNHYDIVLMDVQMPVMNGIEATRYIREQMPAPKNKVPIIALTASVLRADLDLCIQSGMTAYVPKPFKPWQLINTMADVTGRERTIPGDGSPKQHRKPTISVEEEPGIYGSDGKVTDLLYLKKFCDGDEKRMIKYINVYLKALPVFFKNIEAATATKDFNEIALHIHSFKPKWMMMGMKQTNELGIRIDQLCKAQNEKAFEDLDLLLDEVNKSIRELETSA